MTSANLLQEKPLPLYSAQLKTLVLFNEAKQQVAFE